MQRSTLIITIVLLTYWAVTSCNTDTNPDEEVIENMALSNHKELLKNVKIAMLKKLAFDENTIKVNSLDSLPSIIRKDIIEGLAVVGPNEDYPSQDSHYIESTVDFKSRAMPSYRPYKKAIAIFKNGYDWVLIIEHMGYSPGTLYYYHLIDQFNLPHYDDYHIELSFYTPVGHGWTTIDSLRTAINNNKIDVTKYPD